MSAAGFYRLATRAVRPLAHLVLARRAARGKEDPARLGERWGVAGLARPAGRLVWLHAASVGESLSLLPIIDRLLDRPDIEVLVTTGTVTSARLLANRLPPGRARHQFAPLDHPAAIARFLDHWRPDLAIWVESELWPNLVLETRRRGVRMALVNARLSAKTSRNWRRWPGFIHRLLDCFDLVLAQDEEHVARLRALGAAGAETVGDLKAAAFLPDVDESALAAHLALIGDRPAWLAASTHEGEEEIVASAHRAVAPARPGLLTLLAPRHPHRGAALAAMLRAQGFRVARRSEGEALTQETEIYLADTMGEMNLLYRLAEIVLVAGSLFAPGTCGGHNPLEAAQLGRAILFGPDTVNCAASAAALEAAGGARRVTDADDLAKVLAALLADPAACAAMGMAAWRVAEDSRAVIDRVFARLAPLIDGLAQPAAYARP
ncbi:MAG TPA: 3-deoxy-D-manno-octulosonic acid transferase [Aliidongia sp.]|nr:3-deoxy-D-manno-octulosonic acid transferase [Aliidongia sp.]